MVVGEGVNSSPKARASEINGRKTSGSAFNIISFWLLFILFHLGHGTLSVQDNMGSFLGLEGLHVFITGAAGGIGKEAVREFLGS